MRKSKIFFGSLALLSMGLYSCSSDEPVVGGGNVADQDGGHYMAFTITTSGLGGTRAAQVGSPDEFENAVGAEGTITADKLYFLFFDENGNAFPLSQANVEGTVTTNMVRPTTITASDKSEGDGAATTVTGLLVLGKAAGPGYIGKTPTQVLCVANPTKSLGELENKNLSTILAQTTVPPTSWADQTFLMTSSTYVDDNAVVTATNVEDKFAGNPEDAKKNPAVLYIERLTAKVRASYNTDGYTVQKRNGETVEQTGKFILDDEEVTFTAEINGWQLRNLASQGNAFKQLKPADYAEWTWTWNDASKHRSYWAESNQGATLRNTTYDIYNAAQFTNKNYNAATPTQNIQYCYENTGFTGAELSDRTSSATAMVVKATIKKDGEPIDMLRWAGTYYSPDKLKAQVATTYNAAHPNIEATADDVSFVYNNNKDNKYHAVVTINGTTTDMSEMYGDLLYWKNGVTSYYLNIEHLGGLTGVVRNHIYDYVLDGIVGLGVPGNDPVNPQPETESYLAAHVYVLNWHVVSNTLTLE